MQERFDRLGEDLQSEFCKMVNDSEYYPHQESIERLAFEGLVRFYPAADGSETDLGLTPLGRLLAKELNLQK